MGPVDFFLHLLSFLAPAAAVALLVAGGARVLMPKRAAGRSWIAWAAINFVAGALVLAAGLWYFGHDGKMATYGALVLAVASVQWLSLKAWRP